MNSRLKAILGLVLLFAVGIATGIAIAPHFQKHDKVKPFPAAEWIDTTVADYHSRLSLTGAEEKEVQKAVTSAAQEIVRVRSETQQKIQEVLKSMNSVILPKLSSQNQEALRRWLEEKRAVMGSRATPCSQSRSLAVIRPHSTTAPATGAATASRMRPA